MKWSKVSTRSQLAFWTPRLNYLCDPLRYRYLCELNVLGINLGVMLNKMFINFVVIDEAIDVCIDRQSRVRVPCDAKKWYLVLLIIKILIIILELESWGA